MANIAGAFNAFDRSLEQMAEIEKSDTLRQLERAFNGAQALAKSINVIHAKVAIRLLPMVRAALAQAYAASGLKTGGPLQRAVMTSVISISPKGINIRMPSGLPLQLYAQAGALQYGALRGFNGGKAVRKRHRKLVQQVHSSTGQKSVGGASYVAPHPYYDIDASMDQIEAAYAEFFEQEAKALLRGK